MHVGSTFVFAFLISALLAPGSSLGGELPHKRLRHEQLRMPASMGLGDDASAPGGIKVSQAEEMLLDSKEGYRLSDDASGRASSVDLVNFCRNASRTAEQPHGYEGCLSAKPAGNASSLAGAALLVRLGH